MQRDRCYCFGIQGREERPVFGVWRLKIDLNKIDLINLIWGTSLVGEDYKQKSLNEKGLGKFLTCCSIYKWNFEKLNEMQEDELYRLYQFVQY